MSIPASARVHETAVLLGDVTLGEGAEIGPFCHVIGPVTIGQKTTIGSHSVLQGPILMGERNTVQSHCVLGSNPESRGASSKGRITIGNDNILSDRSVVTHGTLDEGTTLGHRNYLLTGAHVSHDCSIADDVTMAHNAILGGHVKVHDGATFGIGATVHQHSTIGAFSMLGMNAVVIKDVPPFTVVAGCPARFRRWNTHRFGAFNMENTPSGEAYQRYVAAFENDSKRAQIEPQEATS